MILTPEQIEKAVEWWAKDIQNPRYKQIKPANETEHTIRASALHNINFQNLPELKIKEFKSSLRDHLIKHDSPNKLEVDFHPSGYLEDVSYTVGIPEANFSIKTEMIFHYNGTVSVSHGFGEPYLKI